MSSLVYCRFPDVHDDDVVFVADDDIWLCPADGGRAQRLTTDQAPCANPRFSPNGRYIAWTSQRNGEPDAYLLERATGAVKRLTWFGSTCLVAGWIDDEHVLVASGHQEVFPGLRRLYSVALDGEWVKLALGPAMGGAWSPDGAIAVNTPNNRDSSYWKRYRGGTAAALWCHREGVDLADGWVEILPDEPAGKYAPGWVGDRLIFTSDLGAGQGEITDPSVQAQLYSVKADGTDLVAHTSHTLAQGYVRDASTDGRRVVYHARGVIYVLDGLDEQPRALDIDFGVTAPASEELDATGLGAVAVDEKATGSLVEWHGAAFFLTHRAGPARALIADPAVRVRQVAILNSNLGVVVANTFGDDAIETVPLNGLGERRQISAGGLGRVLELAGAPDGGNVALSCHDGRVLVVNIATGDVRQVAQVSEGDATHLVWSPDSRYLVWAEALGGDGVDSSCLRLVDTTSQGEAVSLTSGGFQDFDPVFTSDGKYLAWLSRRNFDPHYSDYGFDLAFSAGTRVFVSPLSPTQLLPFGVSADGWPIGKDEAAKDADVSETPGGKHEDAKRGGSDGGDQTSEAAKPKRQDGAKPAIDVAGFEARAVALPVPAGDYTDLAAVNDGLAWLSAPSRGGELGSTWVGTPDKPSDRLERYSFVTRKVEVLAAKAAGFAVSGDGVQLVVRHRDELVVIPVDRHLDDDDEARVKIDLSRLRRRVDRRAQWRQMFDENGRLMADHFWRADMDGTDWSGVLESYRPAVDKAMTRSDVYDIMYECVAELNTGHCYIIPRDEEPSASATGYLGVETTRVDAGFRIDAVLPGNSSDPNAWSPLRAAGVDAQLGDVIAAVDGRSAAGLAEIGALLEGAAGKTVELTLRRTGCPDRRVAVVALASQAGLRYHDWVDARLAHVEAASNGRLGYVHVPDMMSVGWAQLERLLGQAAQHEGVIADMRYNRGGHTSQLVINKLTQQVLGWDMARHYATPSSYPVQGMRGPVIVLANQWSGSDGDIVTAASKLHGLPVVGMRTWGGVIGIDSRYDLVDGTTVTQPRFSSWFEKFEWGIENHGIDPDVEVRLTPGQWANEDDDQLDEAIALALAQLDEHPAAKPPADFPPARFG